MNRESLIQAMRNNPDQNLSTIALENTRDGVVVTDRNSNILFVNSAFTEVTGYTAEEVIGKKTNILKSHHHNSEFYAHMWHEIKNNGYWQGEIWDRHKNGKTYLKWLTISEVKDSDQRTSHFVGVFTTFKSIAEQIDKTRTISELDVLDKLPNRNQLALQLEQHRDLATRDKKLLLISILDLDDFRAVNNLYGQNIGNRILKNTYDRLIETLSPSDIVHRLGGDEFLIISTGLRSTDLLETFAQKLLNAIAAPMECNGKTCEVTASMGITLYPFDNTDSETLLRHADQAMYKAKENGKNYYHLFDTVQDHKTQTRRQLLHRLAVGLASSELVLHYQPKVNLRSGKVIGVEALVRWMHPEQGLLSPSYFLPHTQHHELIVEIGEWAINEALTQAGLWRKQGLHVPISINIAAKQLLKRDFVDTVKCCLDAHPDTPKHSLEIEILESAALENTTHVSNVIEQCQELGIKFALDDFGTGYASLSYLRNIPADTLKIDQSFVRDVLEDTNDLTLIEGIVGLATAFGRTVIAEGVETAEQGVLLMRIGCDTAQGYGIASPMPPEEVPNWVKGFEPDPQWALWADTSWEMNDFPLLVAQYDHIKWVRHILMYMEGAKLHFSPDEVCDHHNCRFGHWYYGYGSERYGHLAEFQDIEGLHIGVHNAGKQIIDLVKDGEQPKAQEVAAKLLQNKDYILEKLSRLQHRVANPN